MRKFLQVMAKCLESLAVAFFSFCALAVSLEGQEMSKNEQTKMQSAVFAGGCFWCLQHEFDEVAGVISTEAGYIGGSVPNPTYEEVTTGKTGHAEAVRVLYNPEKVSYEELLEVYWHNIDPMQNNGQFSDQGEQYRPIIFYENKQQKRVAEKSKQTLIKMKRIQPVVQILPLSSFYPAEKYHQQYWKKNSIRYKFYRYNSGRDKRLKEVWGE